MIKKLKQHWWRFQIWWCSYNLAIIDKAISAAERGKLEYTSRQIFAELSLKDLS